jgi:SAM-dependent methyltransferase
MTEPASAEAHELYPDRLILMLEAVWGEGFLSPGGPEEVALVLKGVSLEGKSVLDIGSGAGGIDILLAEKYGASHVTGIDVEDTVIETARRKVQERGLAARIDFVKVAPGPLPFPPSSFDIVFSKDSIVHIPDKLALAREVFWVLKPGGWFLASDWLIGHDGEPSLAMRDYIAAEGLDFGMASPGGYRKALEAAGFGEVVVTSRNGWYREVARKEIAAMKGSLYEKAAAAVGGEFVDHNIAIWEKMLPVLETGEHCPSHLRARKPGP